MPRVVALECDVCKRKFGGDEALKRHRFLAGDRYRCMSDAELLARNYYRDEIGVYHRGASLFPDASSRPVERGRTDVGPFVTDTDPKLMARTTDPLTSKAAAVAIAYKTGSAKARLLLAYHDAYMEGVVAWDPETGRDVPTGLTDEEAAARVGMDLYAATKRCSDLRRDGAISPIGVRKGAAGMDRQVCTYVSEAVSA